ncbi:DUF6308 family protein [Amycolatopsis cihanbeyliensis]|uniref:Uncharacterized protein n=1 Tax=Amycolatopsis cihanbeyliensis TaxID=1128664 RepID=A0A542CTC0_AMYCI|nr:DUF6308 family protein [Amycolatopsis cihanbeyliensis]TQI94063.1 hypothetical protein FB471_6214 [Amycolatopsis cihanbeyliensis]
MRSIADLRKCASAHLDTYVDPRAPFAFATYDQLYDFSGTLTAPDCLAANLLTLRLRHDHVIPLFQRDAGAGPRLLAAMQRVLDATTPDEPAFAELDSIDEPPFRLVRNANLLTEEVPQWTAVTVSKVLHRLRPHLVPICDALVRRFYLADQTVTFYRALHDDVRANRDLLAAITRGRRTPDGRPLSELRALDIVIWHHERYGCCVLS